MSCCGKIRGAAKLVQSELGIGLALPVLVDARRRACESCPKWEHGRCLVCRCFTWSKTRIRREECPEGRWPSPTDPAFADRGKHGEAV